MATSTMGFSNYKFYYVGLEVGLMALCIACQSPPSGSSPIPALWLPQSTVRVESLRQPQRVESTLTLAGTVTQRLAILDGWLYQLNDGTGQVWVLSQQTAPMVGTQVYVKGVLQYKSILIREADLGDYYLAETQRQLQTDSLP